MSRLTRAPPCQLAETLVKFASQVCKLAETFAHFVSKASKSTETFVKSDSTDDQTRTYLPTLPKPRRQKTTNVSHAGPESRSLARVSSPKSVSRAGASAADAQISRDISEIRPALLTKRANQPRHSSNLTASAKKYECLARRPRKCASRSSFEPKVGLSCRSQVKPVRSQPRRSPISWTR